MSPNPSSMSEARLSGVWSKRAASGGAVASDTAGSGSNSRSTLSAESSAAARLRATTRATGSPT